MMIKIEAYVREDKFEESYTWQALQANRYLL